MEQVTQRGPWSGAVPVLSESFSHMPCCLVYSSEINKHFTCLMFIMRMWRKRCPCSALIVRILRAKMTYIKSNETACKCCRKQEGRDPELIGIQTGFREEREPEAGTTCLGKDDSGKRTPGRPPRAPSEVLELALLAHRSIPRCWHTCAGSSQVASGFPGKSQLNAC